MSSTPTFKTLTNLFKIAVLSTIPWDSYLIENQIWTYPPDAVLGPTIWSIPIEEVFFFIIQTYNTSLLYIVLTKRLVKPMYLSPSDVWKRNIGIVFIVTCLGLGIAGIHYGGKFTYLGLIVGWVSPFMLIQWYGIPHVHVLGDLARLIVTMQACCMEFYASPSMQRNTPCDMYTDCISVVCRHYRTRERDLGN